MSGTHGWFDWILGVAVIAPFARPAAEEPDQASEQKGGHRGPTCYAALRTGHASVQRNSTLGFTGKHKYHRRWPAAARENGVGSLNDAPQPREGS